MELKLFRFFLCRFEPTDYSATETSEATFPQNPSLSTQSTFPALSTIVNVEDDDEDLSLKTDVFVMLVSSFQGPSSTTTQFESSTAKAVTSSVDPAIATTTAIGKSILETILEEPNFEADKQASPKGKRVINPSSLVLPPLPSKEYPKTPPLLLVTEGITMSLMWLRTQLDQRQVQSSKELKTQLRKIQTYRGCLSHK